MNNQLSTIFCICIALAIPLLVLSISQQEFQESMINDVDNDLDRVAKSNQKAYRPAYYNDHHYLKKAADFEQILKPCNQIPASDRGFAYADCVRSRMLLMGKRKRRESN